MTLTPLTVSGELKINKNPNVTSFKNWRIKFVKVYGFNGVVAAPLAEY